MAIDLYFVLQTKPKPTHKHTDSTLIPYLVISQQLVLLARTLSWQNASLCSFQFRHTKFCWTVLVQRLQQPSFFSSFYPQKNKGRSLSKDNKESLAHAQRQLLLPLLNELLVSKNQSSSLEAKNECASQLLATSCLRTKKMLRPLISDIRLGGVPMVVGIPGQRRVHIVPNSMQLRTGLQRYGLCKTQRKKKYTAAPVSRLVKNYADRVKLMAWKTLYTP